MITKVLLKVLDDCYESLSLALCFCLEDVAKDMFSKGLISESTMTSPNYDTVINEFKTVMKEKEDTPQLEKYCRLFLTCLSRQGGPAEAGAEDLAEQWKEEVQRELNISLSLDVVITDEDMKQMESELVEANTEMTEHITTNETEHLEGLDIRDHFNELLRQFKHELHGKLAKGEEKLSNITDFVQQLVSTEDSCDVKDLDEVVKKLDCYYNFSDCQIIIHFARRFASPALLQKFENHSEEAKSFRRSHTIKILQNSFDVNFESHQANASISLNIAWGNVIIDRLYMLIEQFSVKHGSHFVLKHIKVTESSVHIEYFMSDSSMEIIAHAQEKASFMFFIGIYEFTINGHTILQVNNEENFTFELALLNAARTGHNEAVQFLLDLTDNTDHCNEEGTTALMLASEGGYEPVVKSLLLAGANVNSQDNNFGWTALMIASKNNHITIVHTLLEVGADPHLLISKLGANALIIACMNGHSNVVELLLNAQADANSQASDGSGLTALMIACIKGHIKVVELLLDRKVDPNIQNTDGKTALRFANENGHYQTVEVLLKHHANPNIQDIHGYTELHSAVLGLSKRNDECGFPSTEMPGTVEDHIKIVQLLISHSSIDIDAVNDASATGLMCASFCGCTQVVELLLEAGANPNIQIKTSITMKNTMSDLPGDILLQPQCKSRLLLNASLLKGWSMYGWTALMFASSKGHLDVVQILLQAKAKPDLQNETGATALLIAAEKGYSDVVQKLLECGANPNLSDRDGRTSLYAAVYRLSLQHIRKFENNPIILMTCEIVDPAGSCEDYLTIIQLLIAQPNVDNLVNACICGCTCLQIASMYGCTDAVELLLQVGADPNIQTYSAEAENGRSYLPSKMLLQPQIKTYLLLNDFQEMSGLTALMYASRNGHSEVVQLLLNAKAKCDLQTDSGETALYLAVIQVYPDIVQLLLEYGADPNISNRDGVTAIHAAVASISLATGGDIVGNTLPILSCGTYEHHLKIMKLLIAQPNVKINETNFLGLTILMAASSVENAQIVEQLLEAGADPNISSKKTTIDKAFLGIFKSLFSERTLCGNETIIGWTALTIACAFGHLEVVKLLLKAEANPNHQKKDKWTTALMIAAKNGFSDIVQQLLEYGADPNIEQHILVNEIFITSCLPKTHTIGYTALIYACERMHSEVVNLLLQAKADPNHENALALMFSALQGHPDIVQQLLEYGADPNSICNVDGSTALHCVLSQTENLHEDDKEKKLKIIQRLIEKGANINIQNEDGVTALMMASNEGLSEIVELLLQNGADPNIHSNNGRTALMRACNHGNSKVAKHLLRFNANPQLVDNDGFTASIHALCSGNKGVAYEVVNDREFSQNELKCLFIMDLLEGDQTEAISRLDDITDLTTDKKELLISCVVGSLEDVIGKLHESCLHPDTPLVGGLTLLMIASSCGYIELVEYLVIMEADINQRDIFWKYTPLFYAILGSKSNDIVELLLENGADINAVARNQTPLDVANSSPVKNLISSLLLKNGGQTFSELTSEKSGIQPPIKKNSPNFAKFSNQVKSLIQDTVVKREHTECTHT